MPDKKPSTLAEALTAFQKQHHAAGRDGNNPFYKSNYTTLGQALLAVQPATEYGLCHIQPLKYVLTPEGEVITIIVTKLMHISGQEEISEYPVPKVTKNVTNEHQEVGKAITYARRYSLLAMYGLAGEDDDAQSLTKAPPAKKGVTETPTKPKQKPKPVSTLQALPEPISKQAKENIFNKLQQLKLNHPDEVFQKVLNDFKQEFGIRKEEKVTGYITTAAHGEFLSHAIAKIDETL